MNTSLEVIGVYPIEADEPVHLVELFIKNSQSTVDVGLITQEVPDEPRSNWQVPYDEKILDATGTKILADPFLEANKPGLWMGDVRLAFFFHDLDVSKRLNTPLG